MSSSVPYSIENSAGRLVEARVFDLRTNAELESYIADLAKVFRKVASVASPVLCADHRPVRVYPGPVADALIANFQKLNTTIERVAILVAPSNAVLLLQLERIVREAHYTKRKVFKEPAQALAHLGESLNPGELSRARTFLAGFV
ncbi:MAG: hypothetical protein U0271_25985 [Polyangiaceae bacterium]